MFIYWRSYINKAKEIVKCNALHTFKITNSYHGTQVTIRGPYNQRVSYRTQNNEEMS